MTQSGLDIADVETPGATRRALLLGAGALGAAGLLGACGGSDNGSTAGTSAPATTSQPGGGATTGAAEAIKTSDIPVGGGRIYADRKIVITQPEAGTFKAFDATCRHQGCTVGNVSAGKIICPCHGSQYNVADGSVAQGPATQGLTPKTATVTGPTITVS